jgi:hypothetical protein
VVSYTSLEGTVEGTLEGTLEETTEGKALEAGADEMDTICELEW